MATDTFDVQGQPGSAAIRETAIVLDPITDDLDTRLTTEESVKDSHAYNVNHKSTDRSAETEPNDTTLIPKPISCKSKSVEKSQTSIKHDLSSQTDLFYQVIEIYQNYTKGRHLPPDFDIRNAHNWDEVHQAARLAETKYKKDGTRSIFGKIGRGIQRSTPAVEPWLQLIPDGDYTSVLCGGLKIAFGIAGRIHAQREQIFETIQQIPETIRLAEDRLVEWPDDETLQDAAIELYLAVLKSIEAMIMWLVDTSTRRKIWQLLMNPKREKPNDFGLEVIQKEVKRLQSRARTLQSKALVRIDTKVEKTGSEVDIIKFNTQNIERILIKELRPVMHETRDLVQKTRLMMDVFANTTRSDIRMAGTGSRVPGLHWFPVGSHIVFGRFITVMVLRYESGGTGVLFSRQLSSISPEQWEGISCHIDWIWVWNSNREFEKRHANGSYLQNFATDPNTSNMQIRVTWFPQLVDLAFPGENALHDALVIRTPKSKKQDLIRSKL